jgi:dienelactone hydrolase
MPTSRLHRLFLVAVVVIAVHVIDDSFLQPAAGTSAGDHLVSGLVPLAVLGLAAWAYPRLGGLARGALALFLGPLGVAAGLEAAYYTGEVGASGDDFTGLLAIPAGLLLIGVGAVTLWTTRRRDGGLARRGARRAGLGVAGVLLVSLVVVPIGFAYVITHTGRAVVPADALGVGHEDVAFETRDGLTLRGWYVPSRNGAAVIAFPGRKGPQSRTRMLARHGYGVLLFDRRGEGASDGAPNAYGWGGDADIEAAIAYLRQRPDVDPGRIGGIGLSVGGELMLETAAETGDLAAVVSEGAGFRMHGEELDQPMSTLERALMAPAVAVKNAAVAVFSDTAPPDDLEELVTQISPTPMLLIAAPNSPNGELLNRRYHRAANEPKELWEIPESRHIAGLATRPAEYERRVVGFFDRALLRDRPFTARSTTQGRL